MTEETTNDVPQEDHPAQDESTRVPEHDDAAQQEESATSNDDASQEAGDSAAAAARKKSGAAKRIDELTGNWRKAERDRDYWRELAMQTTRQPEPKAQSESKAEPTPKEEDFTDYNEYLRATARWEVRQELAQDRERQQQETRRESEQREKQERAQQFSTRAQEFVRDHPDFWDVAGNPNAPITQDILTVAQESDMGPQVLYHLGQHPDEAMRIAQMSPTAIAREVGRLEARLQIPPKPKSSQAPDPLKPVGGKGEGTQKTPDQMTTAEWMAWRNKQLTNR